MTMKFQAKRIVTHTDFDGMVSAAIVSRVSGCEKVIFTGPNSIARAEITIGKEDVVCDLPYPLECGLWFDHHPGSIEALALRGIDHSTIAGRFAEEPSCARVVFDYFKESGESLPPYLDTTVAEADMIDSFNYTSVEEWRRETPGKLVDMSIKARFRDPRERTKYLSFLVLLIRDKPIEEVAADEAVRHYLLLYRSEEERMLKLIEQSIVFMPQDKDEELIIVDLTGFKKPPRVIKNLSFLLYPKALGVVSMNNLFHSGRKTNDISVAISLSMNLTGKNHGKDVGEIMRELNIGDGHRGAAAGLVYCTSKQEMLRKKEELLSKIWSLWKSMPTEKAE